MFIILFILFSIINIHHSCYSIHVCIYSLIFYLNDFSIIIVSGGSSASVVVFVGIILATLVKLYLLDIKLYKELQNRNAE